MEIGANNTTNNGCCIAVCLKKTGDRLKDFGFYAGCAMVAVVFAVVHPIFGLLGSIGCLLHTAYQVLCLNYHWRHTREKNEDGKLIPGTELTEAFKDDNITRNNYTRKDGSFEAKDIERLEHEKQRIHHLDQIFSSLKFARGLAKLMIPFYGIYWAYSTELGGRNASISSRNNFKNEDWDYYSATDKIDHHLNILKKPTTEEN